MATASVANRCLSECIFYRWDKRRFIRDAMKVKKLGTRMDKRLASALWCAWKRQVELQQARPVES